MTFSSKIKREVSTVECTRAEYLSELSGIIRTNAEIKIYNIKEIVRFYAVATAGWQISYPTFLNATEQKCRIFS